MDNGGIPDGTFDHENSYYWEKEYHKLKAMSYDNIEKEIKHRYEIEIDKLETDLSIVISQRDSARHNITLWEKEYNNLLKAKQPEQQLCSTCHLVELIKNQQYEIESLLSKLRKLTTIDLNSKIPCIIQGGNPYAEEQTEVNDKK